MNMTLWPYPGYRDSGLPWLGSIPAHWEVRRNGRLFAQRVETGFPDLPILEVSLRTGVRVRDMDNAARKQIMSDFSKYKRAERGDIAYNMMRLWQGAVGLAPTDGLVSPAYVVARPFPEVDGRYYSYLFRTAAYMAEVNKYSRGIVTDRNRLYWEEFKQMPSVCPPHSEQGAIADFLDAHGQMVHRLIQTKQRLINLLHEQKQAIVHRIVTRGLDPNARFTASGVAWLGDVPEHWGVKKLKWVAHFNPAKAEAATTLSAEDKVVFLPMERVGTNGEVDASEYRRVADVWQGFTYFRRGDVVVAKITPCFENGKGAYLGGLPTLHGFGTTEFIVLRAIGDMDPRFLYLLTTLKTFRILGADNMTGAAGQQRVPIEFLRNFIVPVPPAREQRAILLRLSQETQEVATAIDRTRREIDLLREYRARLIADTITGKVDVRNAVPPALDGMEGMATDAGADIDDEEEQPDSEEVIDADD